MLCVGNFGGPPTINLIAEILAIIASTNTDHIMMIPVVLLTFLAAAYSLLIYANTSQGSFREFSQITPVLIFRELLTTALHVLYLIILFFWFIYTTIIYFSSCGTRPGSGFNWIGLFAV